MELVFICFGLFVILMAFMFMGMKAKQESIINSLLKSGLYEVPWRECVIIGTVRIKGNHASKKTSKHKGKKTSPKK